jgi:hypothetical protein
VSLSLAGQDKVFEQLTSGDRSRRAEPLMQTLAAGGESLTALASRGGNPAAGRALATANAQESMRLATGAIAVNASISPTPPMAFASGGATLGFGGAVKPPTLRLDPERLRRPPPLPGVDTGPGAGFQVGGQVVSTGPGGLKADVGATRRLQDRVQFR